MEDNRYRVSRSEAGGRRYNHHARDNAAAPSRSRRGRRKRRRRSRFGKIFPFLICAVLLAGFFYRAAVTASVRGAVTVPEEDWSRVIAYVPLDDRIDNFEDAIYLAEASGWRLAMPDKDWFRTALDGQELNANGTPYGNREALFEWVRDMDRRGCDYFILSLDQLFSGGLVNSRSVSAPQTLIFSDGAVMDEITAFENYILPLAEDENNHVWLFDSVVRLSPTVGYHGFGVEEYNALRAYGMVPRPELSGEHLTLGNIFTLYPYAAESGARDNNNNNNNNINIPEYLPGMNLSGQPTAEQDTSCEEYREILTDDLIADYLGVRQRKLTLLDNVINILETVSPDRMSFIIGVDDSSNSPNIQHNEVRYLRQRLGPDGAVMAGLDSLARLLIGRIALEESGRRIKTAVRYFGGTENRHSSEYDLYTLSEVADLHLDFFQAERVTPEEAELEILIMTAPDDPDRADEYITQLLDVLKYNQENHIPTILDEASANAYGEKLEEALFDQIQFAQLVGFAGKYDQANVTGAAFAMGFSRFLYLLERDAANADAARHDASANSEQIVKSVASWSFEPEKADNRGAADGAAFDSWNTGVAAASADMDYKNKNKNNIKNPESVVLTMPDGSVLNPVIAPEEADLAQVKQMANSMALTEYILHTRAELDKYVRNLGLDRNNLAPSDVKRFWIEEELRVLFSRECSKVVENLRGTGVLTGIDPWTEHEIDFLSIHGANLPWNRTFELSFILDVSLRVPE